jgi:predicted AlkP superfamily phosphohydrolase/phosphomutase
VREEIAIPLILIGFDAMEPSVLTDPTRFPTFAGLERRGSHGRLVGQHEYLTDTVWPELRTGTSGVGSGIYYAPLQFRSGEPRARALRPDELAPDHFYWNVAADSGLRVAAVDQPLVSGRAAGAEAEIAAWGTHDWGTFENQSRSVCRDARLLPVLERVGPHPVGECNRSNDGTTGSRRRLLSALHRGIDLRTDLIEQSLAADTWDLFTAVFGESHCAGHHLWPPLAGVPGDVESATPGAAVIESVYRHLDTALARILSAVPPGATVVVYSSHGMAPTDEGAFLVGDVLERLGMLAGNRRRRRLAALVPERLRGVIRRVVGGEVLQRAGLTMDRGFGDPATLAVPLPNSRTGAIRLAVADRDPGGTLVPGSARYRDTVSLIHEAFTELRLAGSGEPVVRKVILTDELYGAERHPDLPDILIQFRTDLGMITACESPRAGVVRLIRRSHRTGEHGTPGAIWVSGPRIAAGTSLGDVKTVEFAPTVLSALGLTVPEWIDGTPLRIEG